MDATFLIIFRLTENARKNNDLLAWASLMKRLLEYGLLQGLLKENGGEAETEEDVLLRADAAAGLLRDYRDEEVGSVLNMTPEERQKLLARTDGLAKEVIAALDVIFSDELSQKKQLLS